MNEKAEALRATIIRTEGNRTTKGLALGKAIIAYVKAQNIEGQKAQGTARVAECKRLAPVVGLGQSTLQEYVKFSMPVGAAAIAKAKATSIGDMRIATKKAPPKKTTAEKPSSSGPRP